MGRCSKACCFILVYATLLYMISTDCQVLATPETTSQRAENNIEAATSTGTCNSQSLIRYIFCDHAGFKSGSRQAARFLMDKIHKIHPAGGPTPEEIQIDISPVASMNVNDSSGRHTTRGLIRPTAAAGILFAILFFAVCAALFCFVYGATVDNNGITRAGNNSNSACTSYPSQSHAIHVQQG